MSAPQPERLDALTGIRPFASFAVFFFHFGRPLVAGEPAWLRSLCGSGYVAVSFFYVLSGFVLTLGHRDRIAAGELQLGRFLVRRVARVLPSALLALAVLLPLALYTPWGRATGAFPAGGPPLALSGLCHLLFVQAWVPSLALTWNLPAWSVSVELAFYLVFPAIARALLRASPRARWLALAAAWAASLLVSGAYSVLLPDGHAIGPDGVAFWIDVVKFWPPARLPEFAFGVVLGTLYTPTWRWARALGPCALVVIAAVLAQAHRLPYAVVHNSLLLPAFGALLVAVAAARGPVRRLLASAPLTQLGRSGYAIYILQMPLMYLVLLLSHAGLLQWSGARFFGYFLLTVVTTALVVQRFIERPGQRHLERWLGRITATARRPAAALRLWATSR